MDVGDLGPDMEPHNGLPSGAMVQNKVPYNRW